MGNPAKYWIKLYLDILRDPKMGQMGDHLFRRTIELFLLAGETGNGGSLPTIEDMAWTLRTTPEQLETDILELTTVGIIHRDPAAERWVVTNFEKRQSPSPAAERMRRMRERQKQKQKQIENSDSEPDPYSDVTVTVTPVTNRNAATKSWPRDSDHAIELVLKTLEFWLDLTGGSLPSNPEPRNNDYFLPVNRLLIRIGWDVDTAAALLEAKRAEMLRQNKTPYRPAAVIPYIMGDLDLAELPDEPVPMSADATDARFDRLFIETE